MTLSRRELIAGVAGLGALMLAPRWTHAQLEMGGVTLDTLSDGSLTLPRDFITGPMPAEAEEVLAAFGITGDVLTPPCNITLLRDGARTVLFDCGAGTAFQPSAGSLPDALEAIGVDPADVTHVVFTHAHPDHIWGVLDDFDDPFFPEAEHMIGEAEWAYWTDPATVDTIGAERQSFAVGAARRLEAIGDAITLFAPGQDVLPGVTAVSTPGHTPGHMAFAVAQGDASAMIVGDAIGNHHLAFARPDWPSGSDQDQPTALATRVALLDQLATDEMHMIGFHLPEGGIGRVAREGAGYRYVPG